MDFGTPSLGPPEDVHGGALSMSALPLKFLEKETITVEILPPHLLNTTIGVILSLMAYFISANLHIFMTILNIDQSASLISLPEPRACVLSALHMAESSNQDISDSPPRSTLCSKVSLALGMVAHAAAAILAAVVLYTAWPGSSLFSWHPTLMVIAYGLLMTEAILMFSPESSLMVNAMRKTKVRFHWILQTGAVVCAVGGLTAIYLNKERFGKEHFTSWHGILGLTTVIYSIVQSTGGINLLYPKLMKSWMSLAQLKMYHATFGLLGYALGCGSLALGINSNWFSREVEGMLWVVCLCCPAILALVIMNQVTTAYLGRRIKI